MPTVVKCSLPGCESLATKKIAASWSDGHFTELKTYGFSCEDHVDAVINTARQRPNARNLSADESIGEVLAYPLLK